MWFCLVPLGSPWLSGGYPLCWPSKHPSPRSGPDPGSGTPTQDEACGWSRGLLSWLPHTWGSWPDLVPQQWVQECPCNRLGDRAGAWVWHVLKDSDHTDWYGISGAQYSKNGDGSRKWQLRKCGVYPPFRSDFIISGYLWLVSPPAIMLLHLCLYSTYANAFLHVLYKVNPVHFH